MINYPNPYRNPNINAWNQNPRQEMEEEQSPSLIFKPIERQNIDDRIKSQLVSLRNSIKDFVQKIVQFKFEEKMTSLKERISGLESLIVKDKSLDQESLMTYVNFLKDTYIKKVNILSLHVKVFENPRYLEADRLLDFLKEISKYEESYAECQPLLFMNQELTNLEMIHCVLTPIVCNYKEILYYEKVDSPIKQYTKNKKIYEQSLSSQQISLLIGLLNKYYKFGALPNKQDKCVAFVKWAPDLNMSQVQYLEKLIIILEIPQEQNNTYALLHIFQQQNLKVCKSTSIAKQRNQLQQLSQQLGCNQFTATLVSECSLDFALSEFLKIVAAKVDIKQLSQFLDENDYFIKEDKFEQGRQEVNYFVDAFEMERLGFSLA
ncbi:unnamed protein product [Paramecium octaurelia]|uniref:Uncharacterized protein n=1 Tax=Paramecium octaurelia TaxID=43137 RepID=A0A8S1UAE9_PAROT|nr:unnamed protein product [Paramecium octaurelia]